jgi:hypothetical protein
MVKDFNEFLLYIDEELTVLAANAVNEQKIKVQLPLTPENATAFLTGIIAANSLVTLRILRQYHRWLND